MLRLDVDLVRHALRTAQGRGYAEVEIELGEDSFQATFLPRSHTPVHHPDTVVSEVEALPTKTITATSVGYYRPGKAAIQVGQEIQAGDLVGEIAALGLKNEVASKWSGTVEEILVSPEQPVEYGQPLVVLKVEK